MVYNRDVAATPAQIRAYGAKATGFGEEVNRVIDRQNGELVIKGAPGLQVTKAFTDLAPRWTDRARAAASTVIEVGQTIVNAAGHHADHEANDAGKYRD
ncbi:hypothetical protein LX16_5352 [Stackebrandtia albiflava]|uniref:Uncharacterized protein n=1 Tax=Stackebrandtia albiflava TaxID=406432 RepID=A0A562UL92_9ACTN|nr:hypothetical protein [Stackebrandtia albiflava]TWJ06388.1 hypothetical protein LX16_5352 [Stackebrandtia albiflava]